jgi:NADH-quinone oxidoreductase subunit I
MATLQQPAAPANQRSYWGNVWHAVKSTAVGMGITFRYLWSKPFTTQYPDEKLPVDERYRGIHYLEQDLCIYCQACAKACPVDCIEMDAKRHGKELEWNFFRIDYQKCMFCELCVYPCPKDCIHMGKEYALVTEDRKDFVLELTTWQGLTEGQKVRIAEAEAAKAAKKAAAAKAKAAKEAKEAAEKAATEAAPPPAAEPEAEPPAEGDE